MRLMPKDKEVLRSDSSEMCRPSLFLSSTRICGRIAVDMMKQSWNSDDYH